MWALDTLTKFWNSSGPGSPAPRPTSWLVEITGVASLCQHPRLSEIVHQSWLKTIESRNASDVAIAITVAERFGLSKIRATAYYAMAVLGRHIWEQQDALGREQRLRLLFGSHELMVECHRQARNVPEITHTTCGSPYTALGRNYNQFSTPGLHACKYAWVHLWKNLWCPSNSGNMATADLIGRMSLFATELKPLHDVILRPTMWAMTPACLESAAAQIMVLSKECVQNLPDHFLDPI